MAALPLPTKRIARFVALAVGLGLSLSACTGGSITSGGLLAATAAVIINEDKTPADLLASAITGLDCDTIRKSRDRGPLCRPPRQDIIEPPLYCYRTLGTVNCFERPNPYGYEQRTIN